MLLQNLIRTITLKAWMLLLPCLVFHSFVSAQKTLKSVSPTSPVNKPIALPHFLLGKDGDLFGARTFFVENIGQYGGVMKSHPEMGRILYAYEGFDMPVLFTSTGMIHLHVKKAPPSPDAPVEKHGGREREEEKEKAVRFRTRAVTMQWIGANPDPVIVEEEVAGSYNTYGLIPGKARKFGKLVYKDLYPGIDLVYSASQDRKNNSPIGFEYSLKIRPGADITVVKLKYGGDVSSVRTDQSGRLFLYSGINGICHSIPLTYYSDHSRETLHASVIEKNKVLTFSLPKDYDHNREVIIDPFITNTTNLTGDNAGKAKDIDFDDAGNVYVAGGGNIYLSQLAKYDQAGNLLWTFGGTINFSAPASNWVRGLNYGGWLIEKSTGKVYISPGFVYITGFQVIRLDQSGVYDNYSTTPDPLLCENWKMRWNCFSNTPQILIGGGTTTSNRQLAVLNTSGTSIVSKNFTGIPVIGEYGCCQDIADILIDPVTADLYTITTSGSVSSVNNRIYKHKAPYNYSDIQWQVPSGYTTMGEPFNRPYLVGYRTESDNSANSLAMNSRYLFYWDGKNLKAFDKASGATAGTPLSFDANTALMQGGIYADECNNVFIGSSGGTIKVFRFDGTKFDDAVQPDIILPAYPTRSVYDIKYDQQRKLLYFCGDGFVGSFDISGYCPDEVYSVIVTPDCPDLSISSAVSPAPPQGAVVSYSLFQGGALIGTNATGTFSGLTPSGHYTVKAAIGGGCVSQTVEKDFTLPGPTLTLTGTNALCNKNSGSIQASAPGGPYLYSIDGTNFQSSGLFSNLRSGNYTIRLKDGNGCISQGDVSIGNQDGPIISFNKTDATCGNATGTITASSTGSLPVLFSVDGANFQSSQAFAGLLPRTYVITAKDATGCINTSNCEIVGSVGSPTVSGSVSDASCSDNDGYILAQGNGGLAPYSYSLDNIHFQPGNIFQSLSSGLYTLTIRDAAGCTGTTQVSVNKSCVLGIDLTVVPAPCFTYNGKITASAINGVAPYQFSLNGSAFGSNNVFVGLQPGVYTVTVKDAANITTSKSVLVDNYCPIVSLTTTPAVCGNTATITASGAHGVAPYQYSMDNTHFQTSGLFTGLGQGYYTVWVKDSRGDEGATQVTIGGYCIQATANSTDATCGDNGTISAIGTAGKPPIRFSLNGGDFQPSGNFSNLAPGEYTVWYADYNQAWDTLHISIFKKSGSQLTQTSTSATCSNNDGSIVASGVGAAPLLYSIDNTHFQSSSRFDGLATGTYAVTMKDNSGCSVSIPATVDLINDLTASAGGDLSVCQGKSVVLPAIADATRFSWSPVTGLSDPAIVNPSASPDVTTTYHLMAQKGPCTATTSLTVVVKPAPVADAGEDTSVCIGNSLQLTAAGGVGYTWSPATWLDNTAIPNPQVIEPQQDITYNLSVTGSNGCQSVRPDAIRVTVVRPEVFAGNDTSVLIGQPLQLHAIDVNGSGFNEYTWSPPVGLNDPGIANPVARLQSQETYTVTAKTSNGCQASDGLSIKVYLTSDIFVPSGFSPNGDGHNDVLKPIVEGIREFKYFAVFNRWGQRIFYSADPSKGWDGSLNGSPQQSDTYVWMTEGVTFKGEIISKKGTVVLVR